MNTEFHIFNSSAEFFAHAKKLTEDMLPSSRYPTAREIFLSCESDNEQDFHGSWQKTLSSFDHSRFEAEASLTDQIIDDLTTAEFAEVKWKFMQRLTEGDNVDVERYLSGNERCWNGCRRIRKMRQSVRIYVNFGGNCFRSKKELAVSGAVGVTFAEIMESMGIAAEIWAVHYSTRVDRNDNSYVQMIRLKAQNEYADMGLVNFMLGNDGVFRNGLFRHNILDSIMNHNDVAYGLGRAKTIDLNTLGLTESEKKTAIVVPQLFDIDRAKDWLLKTLSDEKKLHEITYKEDEIR